MRNSLKYGFISIALTFVITFGACDDKEILKRMEKHSKSLKSLRADITMDRFNTQLAEHDIYKGKLIYLPLKARDVAVRLDWTSPNDESLAFINKQYVLYNPRSKQAIVGNVVKEKTDSVVNEAIAFMNVSAENLKANYQIKYLGQEKISNGVSAQHLEFTPKIAKYYKKVEFWVDNTGTPIQIKLFENNNDTTTILFSNIEKNVTINANVFKINLPKGTRIIKN